MKFKCKDGKKTTIYVGFQSYTGKQTHMLIVFIDDEPELYDWDGTQVAVSELKRYYKERDGRDVTPLRYAEVIA